MVGRRNAPCPTPRRRNASGAATPTRRNAQKPAASSATTVTSSSDNDGATEDDEPVFAAMSATAAELAIDQSAESWGEVWGTGEGSDDGGPEYIGDDAVDSVAEFPPGTCLIVIMFSETASRTLANLTLMCRVRRTPSLCAAKMELLLSTCVGQGVVVSVNPNSAAMDLKNSTSTVHDARAMHSLSVEESETDRCMRE